MASVESQLIEEFNAHAQSDSLEDAREICADVTYFPNNLRFSSTVSIRTYTIWSGIIDPLSFSCSLYLFQSMKLLSLIRNHAFFFNFRLLRIYWFWYSIHLLGLNQSTCLQHGIKLLLLRQKNLNTFGGCLELFCWNPFFHPPSPPTPLPRHQCLQARLMFLSFSLWESMLRDDVKLTEFSLLFLLLNSVRLPRTLWVFEFPLGTFGASLCFVLVHLLQIVPPARLNTAVNTISIILMSSEDKVWQ